MTRRLTIVVGGYIIAYPFGGMTWHHLNYLLGLHELGHEVVFLEDSSSYSYPFDPERNCFDIASSYGRRYLASTFETYGLQIPWCYFSEFENRHYGLSREELHAVLKRADLFIAASGVTPLRADRPRARCSVVIDTDPVFTQLRMMADPTFVAYFKSFDAAATFGRLIGTPDSPLPTHGIDWIPHNQPIALRHWHMNPPANGAFSTIGKWDHNARDFVFGGRRFRSSKGVELLKVIDLPGRTALPLKMAMAQMPADLRSRFESAGWILDDPVAATATCQAFQNYLCDSAGEFTVAKEIYAGLPSGWFSDRSAAYLASGRPVVTQESGFSRWLPTGEGLLSFSTVEQAATALKDVAADLPRHGRAARQIAETYFDSRQVLNDLIDRVL